MEAISVGPWGCEEGTRFSHQINNGRIQKLVILYEGGFKSITIDNSTETSQNNQHSSVNTQINIIKNSDFSQAIGANWRKSSNDCTVEVISGSTDVGCHNDNHVIVSKRKHFYTSIEQDITGEVCVGGVYQVSANVSVKSGIAEKYEMGATVKIDNLDKSLSFLHIGSVFVKNEKWKKLEGWFHLNRAHKHVIFYIEGPPPAIDLCIGPVSIHPVTRQFVVNLDEDEYLTGITGYYRRIQTGMSEVISSLTFLTNRKEYGPYGSKKGKFFSFKTSNGEIIGFHGTSGNYFNSIGCHVKPYESSMPADNNVKKKCFYVGH